MYFYINHTKKFQIANTLNTCNSAHFSTMLQISYKEISECAVRSEKNTKKKYFKTIN